jgi:hypothetical protein
VSPYRPIILRPNAKELQMGGLLIAGEHGDKLRPGMKVEVGEARAQGRGGPKARS